MGKDPQAPKNLVRYNNVTREYISIKLGEKMIDHLEIESMILHKNSDEAKKQLELGGGGSGIVRFNKRLN